MIAANPLVTPTWLSERIHDSNLVILDCSWYLPAHKRNAKMEYEQAHIAGTQFFDIDALSDHANPLPHMLPTASDFSKAVGESGISNNSTIVIYDGMGVFSSPRVWWTFLVFGARNVYILDGGLPAWQAQGFPVTSTISRPQSALFKAQFNASLVAGMKDVHQAIAAKTQIIDARPAGRFNGTDSEPRAGLQSGHMPNAYNLPQSALTKDGFFLQGPELESKYKSAGLDIDAAFIASCGSGVTAASIILGLAVLGKPIGQLYDGSWAEWASEPENPVIR